MRLSIDSRFHRAEKEVQRDFRQGQLLGSPISRAAVGATSIIANVFDAGPKTKVAMTIGDRAPIEMTRKSMPDPFVAEVFVRNETTKKPWIKAELCSHIWTARLPADLGVGAHRIVVNAIGEYGDEMSGRLALEVIG